MPEYRSQLWHVWLWDDWPGRWAADAGIDLVAEDRGAGLWAGQAKHYDPAYAIKKHDVDSFLSESSRAGFVYRLLIASTDHVWPTARRTPDAQEKRVGTLLRSQLEGLEIEWPVSITRLRPAKPTRKRPRPHQRRAIKDCAQGLATAERGQLVMACGTGKTLVGSFLAEPLAAKRVLVLAPSLSLLGQTLREWATAVEFDYLVVCSDDTVTKDEQDAVVATTSELAIPVTTDSERIARFLRRRGGEMKVVFGTYQSSPQIAQAKGVPAFDLVIADEAHRCAGPQAGVFVHRVVTFHSRIDHASRFASSLLDTKEWLPAERRPGGTLWTDHVSGKMTAGERDARLRRLKAVEGSERAVLTNARCLNEGVDVPTLDGVAFIDPRRRCGVKVTGQYGFLHSRGLCVACQYRERCLRSRRSAACRSRRSRL